jgi:hypothetical protein
MTWIISKPTSAEESDTPHVPISRAQTGSIATTTSSTPPRTQGCSLRQGS